MLMALCWETLFLYQWVQGYCPLSLLSGTVYLVLCWDLWFIWSFLCRVISIILFGFFYLQLSNLTSTFCWRSCLLSRMCFWLLYQNQVSIDVLIYVWVFSSILLAKLSVFVPAPCCFYYYNLKSFQSQGVLPLAVLLAFRTVLDILWGWK